MDNGFTHLNGIYKEIAEECGLPIAIKFHSLFKGLNVSFPMKFYCRVRTVEAIRNEYTGSNIRQLAKKYGYSDRWIRKIISDENKRR